MNNDDRPTAAHLRPTELIDSDAPGIVRFARQHACGSSERERAVSLYYAVRDGVRYDAYCVDLSPAGMRASQALETGRGWCVTKAALLAAVSRAVGVPARVGYADVRNHLSTERMRRTMKTDLFIWHGYTELWLDEGWVKATPAFNIELCERFGIHALDWDGATDSLYHPFDQAGRRHMEYVRQRGSFDDVPLSAIVADFSAFYPGMAESGMRQADFDAEVQSEKS